MTEDVILKFLEDPFNLQIWTVHRDLYRIDGKCHECISRKDKVQFAEIKTSFEPLNSVTFLARFTWYQNGSETKSFGFQITMITDSKVNLSLELPTTIPTAKRENMYRVIGIEFGLLKQRLETSIININESDAAVMQSYHENISFS